MLTRPTTIRSSESNNATLHQTQGDSRELVLGVSDAPGGVVKDRIPVAEPRDLRRGGNDGIE